MALVAATGSYHNRQGMKDFGEATPPRNLFSVGLWAAPPWYNGGCNKATLPTHMRPVIDHRGMGFRGEISYDFSLPTVRIAADPLDGQVPRLRHLG